MKRTKKEKMELIADRYEKNFLSPCLKARIKGYLKSVGNKKRERYNKKRERYLVMMRYYKDAEYAFCPNGGSTYAHVGVVIQGPICRADNYTINSVKMFKCLYPQIHIVFSTWEGELTEEEIAILKSYQCSVVESKSIQLQDRGKIKKPCSINNQVYSSYAGVKFLKQFEEIKYVLKIRSDMRLYKEDVIDYFIDMLTLYQCECEALDKRLLCVGLSNFLINVPFHVSDPIWFGTIRDVEKLYSIPLRSEEENSYVREKNEDNKFRYQFSQQFQRAYRQGYLGGQSEEFWDSVDIDERYLILSSEETYFAYKFWESLNDKEAAGSLLEQYHKFIQKYLVIVDEDEVHAYINKGYFYNFVSEAITEYRGRLTHSVWLRMYMQYNQDKTAERKN